MRVIDKEMFRKVQIDRGGKTIKATKVWKINDSKDTQEEDFVYCNEYNRGKCPEQNDHFGRFGGKDNVLKHHMCKKCWLEKGAKIGHPSRDDRCPFK